MSFSHIMRTPATPENFDFSYLETADYFMYPHKYARNEWVRRWGEPKTPKDINACALHVLSEQPNSMDGMCKIL